MSKLSESDCPPSYTESLEPRGGHDLLQQTTGARSQRVNQVVICHILPLLSARAVKGLSKSVIAILPARSLPTEQSDVKAMESLGLPESEENVEDVQLSEAIDTEEFWTQPETLRDLQHTLTSSLSSSSILAAEQLWPTRETTKSSRSFFGRRNVATPKASIPRTPSLQVKVSHEDMCYRVESDFGLYETVTKPVIVVRVDTMA